MDNRSRPSLPSLNFKFSNRLRKTQNVSGHEHHANLGSAQTPRKPVNDQSSSKCLPLERSTIKREISSDPLMRSSKAQKQDHTARGRPEQSLSQASSNFNIANPRSIGTKQCPILIDIDTPPVLTNRNTGPKPNILNRGSDIQNRNNDYSSATYRPVDKNLHQAIRNSLVDTHRSSLLSADGFGQDTTTRDLTSRTFNAQPLSDPAKTSANSFNIHSYTTQCRSSEMNKAKLSPATTSEAMVDKSLRSHEPSARQVDEFRCAKPTPQACPPQNPSASETPSVQLESPTPRNSPTPKKPLRPPFLRQQENSCQITRSEVPITPTSRPLDSSSQRASSAVNEQQELVSDLLRTKGIRGGVFSIGISNNEVFEMPLPSKGIDKVSGHQANVLMNRKKAEPPNQPAALLQPEKCQKEKNHQPSTDLQKFGQKLEPHEVTDQDWLILKLRNEDWSWKDISAKWPTLTGQSTGKSETGLRRRYIRMRVTYPDLVKHPLDRIKVPDDILAARNNTIAEKLRDNLQKPDTLFIPDTPLTTEESEPQDKNTRPEGKTQDENARSELTKSPTNAREDRAVPCRQSPRPTTGGKHITEEMKAYLEAIHYNSKDKSGSSAEAEFEAEETNSDTDSGWRDNSPFQNEDKIHFVYHVVRRDIRLDESEDDVDWSICSDSFTSTKEANEAAYMEVQKSSSTTISPFTSWNITLSPKTGTLYFEGTSRSGSVQIDINRSVRSYHDDVMPKNKIGWLKSDIYDATLKQTSYEETVEYEEITERDEETIDEREVEIDEEGKVYEILLCNAGNAPENSFSDSAYCSESGGEDLDQSEVARIAALFNDNSSEAAEQASPSTTRRKVLLRTVNRTRTITKPRKVTQTTIVVEKPIGGVSALKDGANRIAADEYLRLKRELNPNPEARRPHMLNWEADQKERRAMDKRLDRLDEEYGDFEDSIEYSRGNWEADDEPPSEASSLNRSKETVEVKVKERVLLNPRNF